MKAARKPYPIYSPSAAPKVRILDMWATSPEAVYERILNGERDAALNEEFSRVWFDEKGELVSLR